MGTIHKIHQGDSLAFTGPHGQVTFSAATALDKLMGTKLEEVDKDTADTTNNADDIQHGTYVKHADQEEADGGEFSDTTPDKQQ